MKKLIIIFTIATITLIQASSAMAETSSDSASQTPTNMEEKIKLLVQENLSTTEAKLKEKVDLQSLVGFAGKITTISSSNLTLDSHGILIQVTTNTKTSILNNGSAIKITSLGIGDKIIIIGTAVKEDIIQAKRITVIKDEPILVKTTAVVTKIVSIDLKKKTINLSLDGIDQTLALSKKSTVKLDELQADQTILAIVKEYNGVLSISRAKAL